MLRFFQSATVGLALAILSACGGQQLASSGVVVTPSGQSTVSRTARDATNFCAVHDHIKVRPCPVKLTSKTVGGITVTVTGRGVVSAEVYPGTGEYPIINVQQINDTQFLITSGPSCGTISGFEFAAFGASGNYLGFGWTNIINKYCP